MTPFMKVSFMKVRKLLTQRADAAQMNFLNDE
jgi:hypothetical protein